MYETSFSCEFTSHSKKFSRSPHCWQSIFLLKSGRYMYSVVRGKTHPILPSTFAFTLLPQKRKIGWNSVFFNYLLKQTTSNILRHHVHVCQGWDLTCGLLFLYFSQLVLRQEFQMVHILECNSITTVTFTYLVFLHNRLPHG